MKFKGQEWHQLGTMTNTKNGILICTLSCPWPNRPTQALYNQLQAEALTSIGLRTSIFSPSPRLPRALVRWSQFVADRNRPAQYSIGGVTVHAPQVLFAYPRVVRERVAPLAPGLIAKWMQHTLRGALARVIELEQPGALLVHGALPWGRLVTEVAERHGIPTVLIEHSMSDLQRAAETPRLAREYQRTAAVCAAVATVSTRMSETLAQVLNSQAIEVVENGATAAGSGESRPAEFDGKTVVLAAAHYYRRKGLEELVTAFQAIRNNRPDTHLVLITQAPAALSTQAAECGGVTLLPPQDNADLLKWMRWADLFALPSKDEAFGIVYAESLLAGSPVLMNADCGIAPTLSLAQGGDAGTEHDGWCVDVDDMEGFIAVLDAACSDRPRLQAMGRAAEARAKLRFSWERNARTIARLAGLTPSIPVAEEAHVA